MMVALVYGSLRDRMQLLAVFCLGSVVIDYKFVPISFTLYACIYLYFLYLPFQKCVPELFPLLLLFLMLILLFL